MIHRQKKAKYRSIKLKKMMEYMPVLIEKIKSTLEMAKKEK